MKKYFILLVLFLFGCTKYNQEVESCYWMENYSGKFEWVSTKESLGQDFSQKECFMADSCDGGMGYSMGGCYKWAKGPKAPRINWDIIDLNNNLEKDYDPEAGPGL